MTTNSKNFTPSSTPQKDYYTILYQAALNISSSIDVDQVLQSIVKSTAEALGAKGSVLRLLDPETQQLRMAAAYGLSAGYLAKGPIDIVESPIDRETLCNCPTFIPDVRVDERFLYKEAAAKEGLVSLMCIPLEVRGEVIGVMRVYSGQPRNFEQADREFLTILASLAAQAIENARLYAAMKSSYSGMIEAFWGGDLAAKDNQPGLRA